MKAHHFITSALLLTTTACVSRNVVFDPRSLPSPQVHTTRVFMDRAGEIYPATGVSAFADKAYFASLRYYFGQARSSNSPEWLEVVEEYGVGSAEFDRDWDVVQDSLIERTIRDLTVNGGPGPIIVLIHGYNNTGDSAQAVYDSVHSVLAGLDELGGHPSILELYWDGRTDLGKKLRNPSAWVYAQHNAYEVGLTVRRIVSRLPHDRPVRILAHSHGAKVAAVALWNVTSSLDTARIRDKLWIKWYNAALVDTVHYRRPEHPDLRLGMIVPAMPGNVISDINPAKSNTPRVPGIAPARIVVGRNRHDEAVGKHILRLGWFISTAWGGSTTLGARPTEFDEHAGEWNRPGEPQVAYCVDFSNTNLRPREHSWTTYLAREAMDEFLHLLFDDDSTPTQQYRCGTSAQQLP